MYHFKSLHFAAIYLCSSPELYPFIHQHLEFFKVVLPLLNIMLNQLYLDINVNILVLSESIDIKLFRQIVNCSNKKLSKTTNNVKNKPKITAYCYNMQNYKYH